MDVRSSHVLGSFQFTPLHLGFSRQRAVLCISDLTLLKTTIGVPVKQSFSSEQIFLYALNVISRFEGFTSPVLVVDIASNQNNLTFKTVIFATAFTDLYRYDFRNYFSIQLDLRILWISLRCWAPCMYRCWRTVALLLWTHNQSLLTYEYYIIECLSTWFSEDKWTVATLESRCDYDPWNNQDVVEKFRWGMYCWTGAILYYELMSII